MQRQPPIHIQLSELLRARVAEMHPGERLPSEREIGELYKPLGDDRPISRPTVGKAIDALRREGLVTSIPGAGHFVRARPTMVRVSPGRLRPMGYFEGEATSAGLIPDVTVTTTTEVASDEVADRLAIEPESLVLVRSRVHAAKGGQVFQLSCSYYPATLTEGSSLADPATPAQDGGYERLGRILAEKRPGRRISHFRELVTARPPTPAERAALGLLNGTPVIQVVRTCYADDRSPIEVNYMTLNAGSYELAYDFPYQP